MSDHPMALGKRIALRSFLFGAGFAMILAAIAGIFWWYSSRPKPPKPWDIGAIKATFDFISADEKSIEFYYVLENTTNLDYRAETGADIQFTPLLADEKSLAGLDFAKIHYPIVIPSKQKLLVTIEIPYPYKDPRPPLAASPDERREFRRKLKEYVGTEFRNMDGFVLFDSKTKYQVNFPRGW